MQHVSHFLPTYVDYHLKRAAQIKGKRDNGACCPESPPPNVPLRAPQVRTYQTHKCLGFGGLLGPPVWRHETCGGRLVANNLQQDPNRWKMGEAWRNVVVPTRYGKVPAVETLENICPGRYLLLVSEATVESSPSGPPS